MNLEDARTLTLDLMRENRIPTDPQAPGAWRFAFNGRKRALGLCSYRMRTVFLSRHFVALNDWSKVRSTVVHEIAHVLAGPNAGHGPQWKAIARSLGDSGERCANVAAEGITMAPPTWVGRCPGGHPHKAYRRPKSVRSCAACCPRFSVEYVIQWERA